MISLKAFFRLIPVYRQKSVRVNWSGSLKNTCLRFDWVMVIPLSGIDEYLNLALALRFVAWMPSYHYAAQ